MNANATRRRTPPAPCPRCGRRHRTADAWVQCRFGKPLWTEGRGRYASVSLCHGDVTVIFFSTREDAEQAKRVIDNTACGGCCRRRHFVMELPEGLLR